MWQFSPSAHTRRKKPAINKVGHAPAGAAGRSEITSCPAKHTMQFSFKDELEDTLGTNTDLGQVESKINPKENKHEAWKEVNSVPSKTGRCPVSMNLSGNRIFLQMLLI